MNQTEENDAINDTINKAKEEIAASVRFEMQSNFISFRELSRRTGMPSSQLVKITGQKNYTIATLARVLDSLGLEIEIKKKRAN